MANKIQIRRGLRTHLPTLSVGELGFCTDTKELFVGSNSGNVAIANLDHVHDFTHDHHDLYYQKNEVDQKLATKSNTDHTHTGYVSKTYVDTELGNKSDIAHTHTDKADKTYVDTELSKKANSTALSGHTSNTSVHVTQVDKDNWNGKQDNLGFIPVATTDPRLSDSRTPLAHQHSKDDITDFPTIPSKTSDLNNDSGFITIDDVPKGIVISTIKPTDGSMWYKVIG